MNSQVSSSNLPDASSVQVKVEAVSLSPTPNGRVPVTILMVDDQPSKLLSYEVILGDLGEHLIRATSGREALDYLLKRDIAVVLMDVSMPEIDGFELADMMRQHPRFQETPIIFVSAVHLTDTDRLRGYQSGAVDYISVPVVPDVLRAKVSVFAELHRKTRQLQELNRELEARVAERSEALRILNSQLQERVAELESIMKVLPVGVAVAHDRECNSITGNAALSQILGTEAAANLSIAHATPHQIYCDGHLVQGTELPLQRAIETRTQTGTMELEIHSGDKVHLSVLASASPLFDEEGLVRGAVAAFFDATEHKQMEETLRERAELLELASEAIMVRNAEGKIQFWNAGAEALYGWRREEALGQSSHELLATKSPISPEQIQIELMSSGRWDGNLSHRTKNGKDVVVASRQALKQKGGFVLEINRDITSQMMAEEALRRSDRLVAMGKVAGIVAHEINNPLEAITNTFYLLQMHPSLDEEARYYAQLAEQELGRISHITKQTLSFYREHQRAVRISISELLDDVLSLQERSAQTNTISFDRRYTTKGECLGFPAELKQVFMNLISNAIQALPTGGRVRIRVSDVLEETAKIRGVRVCITDNGAGITADDAEHIFEPFFSTKGTKGTGLGLWISRGIVQKHDGRLRFRSLRHSSRTGTCFEILLPVDQLEKI
jgi:PAS domain S-box-containing protein